MNFILALAQLQQAITEAVEHGQANRAADILIDFQKENPQLSGLIKSLFVGTPSEVVERAATYFPVLRTIPLKQAEALAAAAQRELFAFWNKKRGGSPAPEGKRLKG